MLDNNNFLLRTIKSIKDQAKGIVAVVGAIQRDTGYSKGTVVFYANENSLSLDWLLECEREGCTGTRPIFYGQLEEGALIHDGDVLWRVKKWTHVDWSDENIPSVIPEDVYTKDEANGRFVNINVYNQRVQELAAAIAKKAERGEKGEKGDKGDKGERGLEGATGKTGKSAYDLAVSQGYTGALVEWLNSLKGEAGKDGMRGETGLSAYEAAQIKGFKGTEDEWINSLHGESAYDIAVRNGFKGTEAEWLKSLKGSDGNSANVRVATLDEIDDLFKDKKEQELEEVIRIASLEDIDALFKDKPAAEKETMRIATLDEIDALFKNK